MMIYEMKVRTLLVATLVVIVVCHHQSSAVEITDCSGSSADAKLTSVTISGCDESDTRCPFTQGKNASVEVNFSTSKC